MNKTRPLLFVLIILILAASIFTSVFFENESFLRKWNIPMCPPSFLDSRQFAWASEAYAQGYDPLVENPVNPNGHQLNYPRIWHLLFALGINESHTNIIGTIVVVLFFIGVGTFWFSRKFNIQTYLFLSFAILSPAVMLGIERSNIELVLFFVLSLGLLVNYYSSISALFIFIFAFILKLYPVFGLFYLLKESRKRFWGFFLSASGVFIIYILLTFDDIKQVYLTTPQLSGSSFGINVWWMGLRNSRFFNLQISDSGVLFFQVISYIAAFLIIAGTLYLSLRNRDNNQFGQGEYLDAFRVGAGIYTGCFIVINNHDYRLMFLIFTIPQLVEWLYTKAKGFSLVPLLTLSAMFFSLWSFLIMSIFRRKLTFLLEEFSNWMIFAGLLYLLLASLPDWFFDYLRRPFGRIKHHTS